MYRRPGAAAYAVWGPIHTKWRAYGFAEGALGYPVTDVEAAFDGKGRYVHFEVGSIYDAPGSTVGPHAVYGPIHEKWKARGLASGVLGYPTTDVRLAFDGQGHYVHFEHGSVYQGPDESVGTHAVWGPIHQAWADDGYAESPHGYPLTDVQDITGGQRCVFQHDVAIYDEQTGQVTFTPQ